VVLDFVGDFLTDLGQLLAFRGSIGANSPEAPLADLGQFLALRRLFGFMALRASPRQRAVDGRLIAQMSDVLHRTSLPANGPDSHALTHAIQGCEQSKGIG
jgi:hypothetical protein